MEITEVIVLKFIRLLDVMKVIIFFNATVVGIIIVNMLILLNVYGLCHSNSDMKKEILDAVWIVGLLTVGCLMVAVRSRSTKRRNELLSMYSKTAYDFRIISEDIPITARNLMFHFPLGLFIALSCCSTLWLAYSLYRLYVCTFV